MEFPLEDTEQGKDFKPRHPVIDLYYSCDILLNRRILWHRTEGHILLKIDQLLLPFLRVSQTFSDVSSARMRTMYLVLLNLEVTAMLATPPLMAQRKMGL